MGKGFIQQFTKHKLAMTAAIFFAAEVLLVIFLPAIMKLDPYSITSIGINKEPTKGFILGTDGSGRDLFARLVYGGRTSIYVGVMSTLISVAIGLPLGLIAGYYRGPLDMVIMRIIDVFMSIPSLILALVFVAIFEPSITIIIVIVGVTGWTSIARVIRSNVLVVRELDYVDAARVSGEKNGKILLKYVLPNSVTPLWVAMTFHVSSAILQESSLSFLGAGIQIPKSSWGNMINSAKNLAVLVRRPWAWIPAGLLLMLTVISINLVGEGIRDALDPKMRAR